MWRQAVVALFVPLIKLGPGTPNKTGGTNNGFNKAIINDLTLLLDYIQSRPIKMRARIL